MAGKAIVDKPIFSSFTAMWSFCRATINMRTRVNLDENPVWGEAGRA
jgi:hypothetical protein